MNHGVKRERLSKDAQQAKIDRDKAKIDHYLELKQQVFDARKKGEYTVDSLNKVTDLLVLNPEFYTVWNIRRETFVHLFKAKILDKEKALNDDLQLVMVLIKRFPKCYWIFNHRLWCLKMLGKHADWKFELGMVSKILAADQRNFHGWQLRRIVVQNFENTTDDPEKLLIINLNEFDFTTSKVNNNISNFSAWHNRSKLIPQLYHQFKTTSSTHEAVLKYRLVFESPLSLLMHEINLLNTGMYMDVDDTSIWLYLYWLITDDLFVKGLDIKKYASILQDQLKVISELNDLEVEDNGKANAWCVKTIILIKCLLMKLENNTDFLTDDIKQHLKTLIEVDPLRKGRYLDQLHGQAAILY